MKFANLMSTTFNFRLNVFKFDLLENEGFKRINSILSFLISLFFFFFSFFLNEKSRNRDIFRTKYNTITFGFWNLTNFFLHLGTNDKLLRYLNSR